MTEPLHTVRFPGESDEYRRARDELLQAEIDLRRRTEAVAAKRRALPLGGAVPEDYRFEEVAEGGGEVRFSELLRAGKDTLVVYSFMFPRWPGDTRSGPAGETGRLPLSGSTSSSSRSQIRSESAPSHASVGGETCASFPLRATPTTVTIKPKTRTATRSPS
jgi:hypothetical protein